MKNVPGVTKKHGVEVLGKMTPFHKPHRKPVIAKKANRPKVTRWLIKLDKLFIQIDLEKKEKKKKER